MSEEFICIRFNKADKGALRGMATVLIPKWGAELHSVAYYEKDGRRWATPPARKAEIDGEIKYLPYLRFPERAHYDAFCNKLRDAIEVKIKELNIAQPPQPCCDDEDIPF